MTIFSTLILFSILIIGMAAGALLYRWWLSKGKTSTTTEPRYLIVDEIPLDRQAEKDLDLMKKDLRQRQNLKTSTSDWEDN